MNESTTIHAPSRHPLYVSGSLVALVAIVVALWANTLFCQETKKPAAEAPTEVTDPSDTKNPVDAAPAPVGLNGSRVQYVGPDVYILLDSAGRPQPMPGMSYEDFLEVWKKLNQPKPADNKPDFILESIHFTGSTHGQRAELQFEATVRLLSGGPTDVSLGLVGAILQGESQISGDSQTKDSTDEGENSRNASTKAQYLTFDPDHGGFVARLMGRAGEHRKIAFNIIVPLVHDGSETTLPISCPRALSSQLDLTIDSTASEVRTTGGTLVHQQSTENGGTAVKIAGPTGLFKLAWRAANKEAPAPPSILNALGAIHVTIDSRGIHTDAKLTVRSYGGSFDQVRVRLPAGAQLVQALSDTPGRSDAKYRVRIEPDGTAPGSDKDARGQTAVVELAEKQTGPVVVDLATEQSTTVDDHGQEINLAGFEVLGAVRQFGDIAVNVADDWQARWNIGSYLRQVDSNDLATPLQEFNPTAAFQYDRQPWSLKLRTTPRQLRVSATPRFNLECLPDEARLNLRLAYQASGARAFEFRVDLNGWETTGDQVESGGLVDQDRIVITPEGVLVLPLTQASSRRAEISLSLRRPISHDSSRLEIPLPVPIADSVGTGELFVRSAPALELLPDLSNSTGITSAATSPDIETTQVDPGRELHFRTLQPSVVFVTDRSNRAREVTAQSSTQIDIDQDSAQIDQRIDYVVRYEPIAELVFEVPTDLSPETQNLDFQLVSATSGSTAKPEEQATPLHVTSTDDESGEAEQSGSHQLHIMLPQPRLGRFAVRIRYRPPLPNAGSTDVLWMVPLIHPADGRGAANLVELHTPRGFAMALDTDSSETSWKSVPSQGDNNSLNLAQGFSADSPELYLPLTIRAGRLDLSSATIVDRVWLQTWFSRDLRQDRAAFRLRTTAAQATVELPPDALSTELEVLVDRQPAEVLSRASGRVVVRLPESPANATAAGVAPTMHTLELRSRQSAQQNLLTRHHLTPPQVEGATALSQVYWQIVLPSDEHIVSSPEQMTSSSQWQWLGAFWGRQPIKSQTDLEQWVSASQQPSPDAHNQYLFTGLLPVSTIELVTAPRWFIVFGSSAALLAVVVAWLYIPAAQRMWIAVFAMLLIVAAIITFPTAALLLAQASLIGLVLSILAFVLSRALTRPSRATFVPRLSSSSQRMIAPRSESVLMPPVVAAASTAPTASLRLAESDR